MFSNKPITNAHIFYPIKTVKSIHHQLLIVIFCSTFEHIEISILSKMNNNSQCFCNEAEDVFKDGNGRILTAGDVILCKGCPFIVLEDGSTDHYTMGKMNHIYYTMDEELGALEERPDKLQAERSTGIVTRLWQTVSGRQRQMLRNQIAGIGYSQQQL